jgi:hypothetical protein
MNQTQKKIVNLIVQRFKERNGVTASRTTIAQMITNEGYSRNDVGYVLRFLSYKGILYAVDGMAEQHLMLTDKGWMYESYDKLIEEEAERKILEREQIESGIQANKAVQQNTINQAAYNKYSFLLACVSSLFILITVLQEWTDTTSKEMQGLKQQMQKTAQSMDSIALSLKGLDSSMKKIAVERSQLEGTKDTSN